MDHYSTYHFLDYIQVVLLKYVIRSFWLHLECVFLHFYKWTGIIKVDLTLVRLNRLHIVEEPLHGVIGG
jgi:hypothetical protein